MSYHPGTPAEGLAMCYPSRRSLDCGICSRFRPGYAMPAELRAVVVIDASAISQTGGCQMFAARQAVASFQEVETA